MSVTSYMRIIHQSGTGLEKMFDVSAAAESDNAEKGPRPAMPPTRAWGACFVTKDPGDAQRDALDLGFVRGTVASI